MSKYSKQEISWILYDVANSAFVLALTAVLPIYFSSLAKNSNVDATSATGYWGLFTSISVIIIAILSPLLGALADYRGMKKKLLSIFLIVGIILTCSLIFTDNWIVFLSLILLSRICYTACNVFYDSMITDVTTDEKVDMVSSHGFAWGYIGSCIPFIAGIALITLLPFGLSITLATKAYIIITALWWLLLSIPLLLNVKHIYYREPEKNYIKKSFIGLKQTFKKLFKNKPLRLFVLAYFLYIDGVNTIISMATSYGNALGISATGMIIALLVTQIVAFPASIISGIIAKKFGNSRFIKTSIISYALICVYAFTLSTEFDFFALAIAVGLFQGGIQALSRSHFSKLIPKESSSEYFAFFSVFGKFAEILGPLFISISVLILKDAKFGILALIILFVGGYILYSMSEKERARSNLTI